MRRSVKKGTTANHEEGCGRRRSKMDKVNVVFCFAQMLENIRKEIQPPEYPQTIAIVSSALDEGPDTGTVFDVAYAIHMADMDKPMPECVKSFLMTVYQIGIDEGMVLCMNNMGSLYYTDRAGMKDYKKARAYYEMAADKGYSVAATNVGYIYYYGFDTDIDYEKAYRYFSMAAAMGEIEAIYKTGDMYRYGYYVKKNDMAAMSMYDRALNLYSNCEECKCGGNIMKHMGDVFYEGIGTLKNNYTALVFYQRAESLYYEQIKNGDPFAGADLDYVLKTLAKIRKQIAKDLPTLTWQ